MVTAERRFQEADYGEYADPNASGAAFCHFATLILMVLLLLRYALTVGNADEDEDDISTFFSHFLLRAVSFLLPCYIIAWLSVYCSIAGKDSTLACSISLLDLVAACSQLKSNIISLGASGALFGLLGSMLSELIINWTIYANKVFIKQLSSQIAVLVTLVIIIIINLAVGLLPHVDNFTHIGGFVSDFVLGFVFLIRPQFGWESQRYASKAYSTSAKPKFKFEKLESKKKKL